MTFYLILKYLHVLLAITAVGTNINLALWLARPEREPQHAAYTLKGAKFLDGRVANPAYGLLLVTGLAMLYAGGIRWTTPWVLSALMLYVVLVVIAARVYTPLLARQIAALEAGGPQSAEYRMLADRGRRVGIALGIVILAIVFLMVTKPALWG